MGTNDLSKNLCGLEDESEVRYSKFGVWAVLVFEEAWKQISEQELNLVDHWYGHLFNLSYTPNTLSLFNYQINFLVVDRNFRNVAQF